MEESDDVFVFTADVVQVVDPVALVEEEAVVVEEIPVVDEVVVDAPTEATTDTFTFPEPEPITRMEFAPGFYVDFEATGETWEQVQAGLVENLGADWADQMYMTLHDLAGWEGGMLHYSNGGGGWEQL